MARDPEWLNLGLLPGADGKPRCAWLPRDPLYVAYHDEEWGRPLRDNRALFELLCLEGAQAGLSWHTILKKREGYRRAFAGFQPETLASWGSDEVARLLADPGIVRNRLKVEACLANARAYLRLAEAGVEFGDYLWRFTQGETLRNAWRRLGEIPAQTSESEAMSKELRRAGFKFVGPTSCYALMQSAGLVEDHIVGCCCKPSQT